MLTSNFLNNIKNNLYYSSALFLVALIIARFSAGFIAYASYLYLIFYMKKGPSQILRVLVVMWFFSMVNPGIFPELEYFYVLRYGIIFIAFFFTMLNYRGKKENFNFDKFFNITLLLASYIILHSLIISWLPEVSFLKITVWSIVVASILGSWLMTTDKQREENFRWFFGFFSVIVVLSALLLPYPEIVYHNNGNGFQGILNQPQAFGLTMALFLVFSLGGMRVKKNNSKLEYIVIACAIFLLLLSKSRTSIFSYIFILFLYMNSEFFKNIKKFTAGFLRMPVRILMPLFVLVIVCGYTLNSNYIQDFILKGSTQGDQDLLSLYIASRHMVIEPMLENIKDHLLFGIGFGVASLENNTLIFRSDFFDIPIGAPVEKSLTPIAVLEELGSLGFIIFILWIWTALRKSITLGLPSFAMVFFILLINLTESLLFSMGGMGMLIWIMLGWSLYGIKTP